MSADALVGIYEKINWQALVTATMDLHIHDLDAVDEKPALSDDNMIKLLHKLLFETVVVEGNLICPESGRKFPIVNGIPNMLLHEDEV